MTERVQDVLALVYQLNPVVAIEDFGASSLALHCVDLQMVELNTTARDVITRLDGHSTLGQIAEMMAKKYDESRETIEADVVDIVANLVEFNLIEQVRSASCDPNGD